MTLELSKRVDNSIEYLHDHFNHKPDHEQVTREEFKDVLMTVLKLLKDDFKG